MTEQHNPTALTPEENEIERAIHELAHELTVSMVETVRDQMLKHGIKIATPALSIAMGRTLASVVCTVIDERARFSLAEMHAVALGNAMGMFDTAMAEAEASLNA